MKLIKRNLFDRALDTSKLTPTTQNRFAPTVAPGPPQQQGPTVFGGLPVRAGGLPGTSPGGLTLGERQRINESSIPRNSVQPGPVVPSAGSGSSSQRNRVVRSLTDTRNLLSAIIANI